MAEVNAGHGSTQSVVDGSQRYRVAMAPYILFGLILLIAISWTFGFLLQHDFPGEKTGWWQTLFTGRPPAFIVHLFTWRVLRHIFIPGLIGAGFAWLIGAGLIQRFYRVSDRSAALFFLAEVVLSAFIPTNWLQPSLPFSRRFYVVLILGLSLLSLGPATIVSAYGLFWRLEPDLLNSLQLLTTVFFATWVFCMIAVLLLFFLQRLSQRLDRAVSIDQDKLEEMREKHVLFRIGGPGGVNVNGGPAVAVSERNGRLLRVLGTGKHYLAPYEKIRAILNLQEHEYADDVDLLTSDGISVRARLAITYRIASDDARLHADTFDTQVYNQGSDQSGTAAQQPDLFGAESIRRAAGAARVDGNQQITEWQKLPFPTVSGQFRQVISRYSLDELFFPDPGVTSRRQDLRKEVFDRGSDALKGLGIELLRVRLGPLTVENPVLDSYLQLWSAVWRKRGRVTVAEGKASAIEDLERRIGTAEMDLLQQIAETVRQARENNRLKSARPLVALRLIETLERLARQSKRLTGPSRAELLEELQALRRHLAEDDGQRPSPESGP